MKTLTTLEIIPEFYDMTDRVLERIIRTYDNGSAMVKTSEGIEKITSDEIERKLGARFIGNGQYTIG